MQWYVHIGMSKTGSSFIQNTLFYIRSTLHKYGYDYPDIGINHSKALIGLVKPNLEKTAFYKTLSTNSKFIDEIKNIARKQIELIHKSNYDSIILSAEGLCGLDVDSVKSLRSEIDPKSSDKFRIIIYVRDPIGSITSNFSQILRGGEIVDPTNTMICYERLISPWIDVFGRDAVDIRIYDENHFKGDGIIKNFLSAIDLNDDLLEQEKIILPPFWSNRSFSMEAIECCKKLILSNSLDSTPENLWDSKWYTKVCTILTMYRGTRFELSLDTQQKILDNNKISIQWLNKVLGHDAFSKKMLNVRPPNTDVLDYKPLLDHVLKEFKTMMSISDIGKRAKQRGITSRRSIVGDQIDKIRERYLDFQ